MNIVRAMAVGILLLVQSAAAQSLGDLARQERERKAKEQKAGVAITTDEVKAGKLDVSPPLDPARKGDLDYLLQKLSHPRVTPELLAAFVPLKGTAVPRLLPMLGSTDPLKRVGPATVLIALGSSDGVASMARLLSDSIEAAAKAAGSSASPGENFSKQMEATRESNYALAATKFGIWRFTEGSALAPDQVVQRLAKGPPIEIVGGVDNGQRIFNRALRDKDANLRQGAIALIRVAAEGDDFGYQPDQEAEQNESAIQKVTSFLTTERAKVVSQLGTKNN